MMMWKIYILYFLKIDEVKMKKNNISRREFLTLAGITLLNSGYLMKDLIKNEDKIYELSDHVHMVNYSADTEKGKVYASGMGFILDGKYITCNHIPNSLKEEVNRTPFGLMKKIRDIENEQAYLGDIKLTELVRDSEKDIAIYDAYGYMPDFPCNPSTDIKLGDEVYIIGNPALRGNNIRKARISDLDGVDNLEISDYCFGIDKPLIGGDSGTPLVNSKYKLVGMNTLCVFDKLGYSTKIKEIVKRLDNGK